MTGEDMEREIASLREQVSQLQQRQEGWKTQWLWWSRIAGCVAITLLAADAFNRVAMHMPYADPPPIFFVMVFLTLVFGSIARPTNISTNTHLRNFAAILFRRAQVRMFREESDSSTLSIRLRPIAIPTSKPVTLLVT